jgi:energy-coupling factor transporter ATP-binding protein EcfA2
MSTLTSRALLWRQRGLVARASISPLATSFRWSSSTDTDDEISKARKEAELAEIRARQRITEADAAAHVDKVKAEAAAHADKVKAEAAAHADKVKADTDKVKAEAAAHADKVKAEAAAHADKVKAEAGSAWDRWWAQRMTLLLSTGALVLSAAYLAYDELTHSKAFIRWNMKRVIRAGPPDRVLPKPVPEDRRFKLEEPEVEPGSPLLILGPSGSGKSSLMAKMVRDLKSKKVPVAYFRTRSSYAEKKDGEPLSGAPALEVAARKFCEAVGYPERPSLLSRWKPKDASVGVPSGVQTTVVPESGTVKHFLNAIDELFEACSELQDETGKVPYIIIDEFHDFMSERLRWAGGETVFVMFANHMLSFGLDRDRVEVVAGASGSELLADLAKLTKAKDDRVDTFYTEDPSEEVVRARLLQLKYSDEVATRIIASCGTRLRILKPFLTRNEAMPEAKVELKLTKARKRADQSLRALLGRAKEAGVREEVEALLNKLENGELVANEDIPPALFSPFPNNVMYWAEGGVVTFQSVPVKTAWKELR